MQLQRFTQLVEGHSIDIWINIDHIESFDEGFNTLHVFRKTISVKGRLLGRI